MGIYDRDYERDDQYRGYDAGYGGQRGVTLRLPQSMVNRIVLLTFAVYVVELFFDRPNPVRGLPDDNLLIDLFGLQPQWFYKPWQAYQLLTYGFLHDNSSVWHILGNMFGFWMFGRELENRLGGRELLLYYLSAIVLGGLAITLSDVFAPARLPTIGASAGTVAVVVLYALYYPHRKALLYFVIPIPMWVIGVAIVSLDLLRATGQTEDNVSFQGHLGGAAFALVYYFQKLRLSRWAPGAIAMPSLKRRPKLRVHHEEEAPHVDELAEEVDRILRKIKADGADSLTNNEKRVLEQASRRYQNRSR